MTSDELFGAYIDGTKFKFLDFGSYGAAFVNEDGTRVVKIFFNKFDYSFVRKTFISEFNAYIIAMKNEKIKNYVPELYGLIRVDSVKNRHSEEISDKFNLNLAYEIQFISGEFSKIGSFPADDSFIKDLKNIFLENGISYTKDASIVCTNGDAIKMIDFATHDYSDEVPCVFL